MNNRHCPAGRKLKQTSSGHLGGVPFWSLGQGKFKEIWTFTANKDKKHSKVSVFSRKGKKSCFSFVTIEETAKSGSSCIFFLLFFFFFTGKYEIRFCFFCLFLFCFVLLKPGCLFIPRRIHHKKELKLKSFNQTNELEGFLRSGSLSNQKVG